MDPQAQLANWAQLHQKDPQLLLKEIQSNIIASPTTANPLFGKKKSIYTDFFASSKPLRKFESIIAETVLPFYANTHTSTTSTSKSTSASVKMARATISRCTNAISTPGHEHQAAVIFCGDGSTSAINKIRNVFRLNDEAFWIRKALAELAASAPAATAVPSDFASASTSTSTSTSTDIDGTASSLGCLGTDALNTNFPASAPSLSPFPVSVPQTSTPSLLTLLQGRFELPPQHRPVVFLSIQEHHSNLLPWRESCADVIVIPENSTTHRLDLEILEKQLILYQHRPLKVGTFSAGSNLTGVLNDTVAISELLHKYGAFAFYDYAGVGPYTTIDMNPVPSHESGKNLAYKDGVFISTHKFLGGPGASGVLVARLEVFEWIERHNSTNKNEYIPAAPGGGTVDMVLPGRHKYTHDVLAREEAGTPNILATIRTGLVFQLQEIVGPAWILQKEYKLAKRILARLMTPELAETVHVLGGTPGQENSDRVAVFSLSISVPALSAGRQALGQRPLQIHHALLSTIMNDFFGVEMRGGCMCAGPYASKLLGFDAEREDKFWRLLLGETESSQDQQGSGHDDRHPNIHQQDLASKSLKPGFVRFSFSYFAKEKDVEFVVQSLEWVAKYGYLLIPLYQLDAHSGQWSVRPAVHKAVSAEISAKYMKHGSREYCIPAAIECINGLKKLLRKSHKANVELDTEDAYEETNSSRAFYSVGQAKKSLVNVLSHVLHRPTVTIGAGSSLLTPPESPTKLSNDSMILHGDSEVDIHGNSRRSPELNPSSSDISTVSAIHDPDPHQRIASKPKKSNIFQTSSKDQKTLLGTFDELSLERLQGEVDSIETSDLAKELRWFVTPLEVVRLYIQEQKSPSVISPFPRQ